MDAKEFHALEIFNIKYDLAIDEEIYDSNDLYIDFDPKKVIYKTDRNNNEEFAKIKIDLKSLYNNELLKKDNEIELKIHDNVISNLPVRINQQYWCHLFLAKKLRGYLQKEGNAPGQLDEIARYLMANLPSSKIDSYKLSPCNVQNEILRIIYLNEISACLKEELQIGYADRALAHISRLEENQGWTRGGNIIYELLSLFNQARGYQHCHQSVRALNLINNEILYKKTKIDDWKKWLTGDDDRNNKYKERYKELFNINIFDIRELRLWVNYIFIPSSFIKAETLIDLNRASEVIEILEKIDPNLERGGYNFLEVKRLIALAKIDGQWEKESVIKGSEYKYLSKKIENIEDNKYLKSKILSFKVRYKAEEIGKMFDDFKKENDVGGKRKYSLKKQFRKINVKINELERILDQLNKLEIIKKNDDEKNQALLLWLDYFDAIIVKPLDSISNESYESIKNELNLSARLDKRGQKLRQIFEKCISGDQWMPDKKKNIEKFVEILQIINDRRLDLAKS